LDYLDLPTDQETLDEAGIARHKYVNQIGGATQEVELHLLER
jgi:hypothetical protein